MPKFSVEKAIPRETGQPMVQTPGITFNKISMNIVESLSTEQTLIYTHHTRFAYQIFSGSRSYKHLFHQK